METLSTQFKGALCRIEIKGDKRDRAIEAHTEIREVVEGDKTLREWGIDPILIGSYSRDTGIHPGKDVDVFLRLRNLSTDADPTKVFEHVATVLSTHYGARASRQRRSVKVDFPDDDFSVDAVPAVVSGSRWAIPTRDSSGWMETDPIALGDLTSAMNSGMEVNGQGAYVPIVKLVRQTRQHHLNERKPGGLYFELLAYYAFQGDVSGGSFAEIFAATLRSIADQLASGQALTDPALGTPYAPAPASADISHAADVFADLAETAAAALGMDRCPAAAAWRAILGSNANGACFPLPEGCDERGRRIPSVTAVTARGSKEPGGFARS